MNFPNFEGKILLNDFNIFTSLSNVQIRGVLKILKNIQRSETKINKIWFVNITKIIKKNNLKIYYLPFENIETII